MFDASGVRPSWGVVLRGAWRERAGIRYFVWGAPSTAVLFVLPPLLVAEGLSEGVSIATGFLASYVVNFVVQKVCTFGSRIIDRGIAWNFSCYLALAITLSCLGWALGQLIPTDTPWVVDKITQGGILLWMTWLGYYYGQQFLR